MSKTNIYIPFLCLICLSANAQQNYNPLPRHVQEAGYPFIQNYTPQDYKAFDQNWDITQDSLGIMYFANSDGVLIYDGVKWNLVPLSNNGMCYAVACADDQTIYIAGVGDMGYLAPDRSGRLSFMSLVPHLDPSDREVGHVIKIIPTPEGIYFLSIEGLYRWYNGKFQVWKSPAGNEFRRMSWIGGKLYVAYVKGGPAILENGKLTSLPGFQQFNGAVRTFLPYDEHNILLGTIDDGLYLYNGTNPVPFNTERDDYLKQQNIFTGTLLADSTYALGTRFGGIVIIDRQGRQRLILNKEKVIPSQKIFYVYQDRYGILWVATDFGISRIEYPSRFSVFNEMTQLNGILTKVARFQGNMYVATENGLYWLDATHAQDGPVLKHIFTTVDYVYDVFPTDENLLLATGKGIWRFRNGILSKIRNTMVDSLMIFSIGRSKLDTNRLFVSYDDGLMTLYYKNGQWVDEGKIEGIKGAVYAAVEMPSGDIWVETNNNSIWRISFAGKTDALLRRDPLVQTFSSANGLPNELGRIFLLENQLYYREIYGENMFRLDERTMQFHRDSSISSMLNLAAGKIKVRYVDNNGNIWFEHYHLPKQVSKMVAWKTGTGKYQVQDLKEERIFNMVGKGLFPEPGDKVVWHIGKKIMVRHDLNIPPLATIPFYALVRNVTFRDSLIHTGNRSSANLSPVLTFNNNRFRFEYAAPFFRNEKAIQFQHYLEGYEENWSDWTQETKADYTNLPEGDYTFKVRAKNLYGQISEEGSYQFTILPPWYRTWWAYLLYLLVAIAVLRFIIQWRSKQLLRKNQALEETIRQRTSEIEEKNAQLEKQAKQLSEQTTHLKELDTMKTRLFANISHEFRTPLTLIKGPIEKLEETNQHEISTENIKMIRRNANRLLKLVNQLLDLSKLDSGHLKLEPAEGDLFKCIRAVASSFSSHAAQRTIDYQVKIPSRMLWTSFDRDKLENILYNLLSNAFKFTADGGTIIIQTEYLNNQLKLSVSDTGAGIEKEKLALIFDRFYQVDDSYTKEKEGTGIGLALTKDLIKLMHGEVYVKSEYGKGSIFEVLIPLEEIRSYTRDEVSTDTSVFQEEETEDDTTMEAGEKPWRILIVEDNSDMRYFIKEQLTQDYEVIESLNGNEGLQTATETIPDLIITDLMMPQMDGITLCKKLKQDIHTCHIPVIMLTAKAGIENKIEGLETGADDYLTKPFNARELQVRVKNLLEQRQRLRELYSKGIAFNPKEITVTSLDEQLLQQIQQMLEERFDDAHFGIPDMQTQLGMSKTQLHRKIKALTDYTPGELLRNFRLKRAAQLLPQQGDNITGVAYATGFSSLSYFTKCFKDLYGCSPSEYIEKNSA